MIHRIIKILFVFVIILNAQSFNSLSVSGSYEFDSQYFQQKFDLKDLSVNSNLRNIITKHFFEKGYLDFKIEKIDSIIIKNHISLDLLINTGKQYSIKNIFFGDEELIESELEEILLGTPANKKVIENTLNGFLTMLAAKGYLNSEIIISSITSNQASQTVDLYLTLRKKNRVNVSEIKFIGNNNTDNKTLEQIIFFRSCELYSDERNNEIKSLLNKTNYFKNVSDPKLLIRDKNSAILQIEVNEKNNNNFDGVLGYVPSESGGYLTGLININLQNLFGTGRNFNVKWQKLNRNSQEFKLSYFEPWIFNIPLNLSPSFYQYSKDTTFTKRILNFELSYFLTSKITAAAIFESETISPSEDLTSQLLTNATKLNAGVNLSVNTKNDNFFPTSGFLVSNKYLYSSKKTDTPINGLTNFSQQKFILDFEYYFEFLNNFVGSFKLNANELRGSAFESADLFEFGGNNSIRGYFENEFSASRVGITNLELRYLLDNNSFVFSFIDFAYYNISENIIGIKNSELTNTIYGYGSGIMIATDLGILSFSYAIGENDSFSNGKIHVGIINEF